MGCHCGEPEPYCKLHEQEPLKVREYPNGPPPYLPQPSDFIAKPDSSVQSDVYSGPGPWAFGRVMWSPTADLIGIRPVVDRYSITRYGMKDWRKKNQDVLDMVINTDKLKTNVKCTVDKIVAGADKHQSQNTLRLEEREKLVRLSKEELECLIKHLREEIVLLMDTKIKLKFKLPALKMPESIAGECIERRTTRLEQDLINDEVEMQLIKELALIKDIRDSYVEAVKQIEGQMQTDKAVKDQLELLWSDKKETCDLESINIKLRNNSPIITFYGGAVRIPENQSSPESWGVYNKTLIDVAKEELLKSQNLRATAEKTLLDSIKELRDQADKVYNALIHRIEEANQCREEFERELQDILRQIVDAEFQYESLMRLQRQLQCNTKVATTRLNNREHRLRIENCKDEAEYGLIDEMKFINSSQKDLKNQIDEVDRIVATLYRVRSNIEYAITTKRKSIYVDQQRCLAYREKYPDIATLGGGNA